MKVLKHDCVDVIMYGRGIVKVFVNCGRELMFSNGEITWEVFFCWRVE